jgi:hypothetical protein
MSERHVRAIAAKGTRTSPIASVDYNLSAAPPALDQRIFAKGTPGVPSALFDSGGNPLPEFTALEPMETTIFTGLFTSGNDGVMSHRPVGNSNPADSTFSSPTADFTVLTDEEIGGGSGYYFFVNTFPGNPWAIPRQINSSIVQRVDGHSVVVNNGGSPWEDYGMPDGTTGIDWRFNHGDYVGQMYGLLDVAAKYIALHGPGFHQASAVRLYKTFDRVTSVTCPYPDELSWPVLATPEPDLLVLAWASGDPVDVYHALSAATGGALSGFNDEQVAYTIGVTVQGVEFRYPAPLFEHLFQWS